MQTVSLRPLRWLVTAFAWLGIASLVGLVGITVFDVVGRTLLNHSLPGSAEAIAMLMGITVYCGLAWAQLRGKHVVVDLVLHLLPPLARRACELFSLVIATAITGVLAWQLLATVAEVWRKGETTMIWHLPFAPPAVLMLLGFALFLVVLLVQLGAMLSGRQFTVAEAADER